MEDYASYRRMIANQIGQLNEDFELDQFPTPAIPSNNTQEQDPEQLADSDNAQKPKDQPIDQLLDDHVCQLQQWCQQIDIG